MGKNSGEESYSTETSLIDSGAPEHMTHHAELFASFTKYPDKKHVPVGNAALLQVIGEGRINVLILSEDGCKERYLAKVLLVPEIKVKLFPSTATLEKGFTINSTKDCDKFLRDGKVQGIGFREGRLFAIN